ncbi:hypothetical protein V6N11_058104 [Hibiscus sabdariffa]|uniref:Uncharacterized protein n=1 Tax=Hibiscus sabdariffa TaxID=183260 RepID=A0ABR2NGB0_9ROSI
MSAVTLRERQLQCTRACRHHLVMVAFLVIRHQVPRAASGIPTLHPSRVTQNILAISIISIGLDVALQPPFMVPVIASFSLVHAETQRSIFCGSQVKFYLEIVEADELIH